jgi:hypothetical protein
MSSDWNSVADDAEKASLSEFSGLAGREGSRSADLGENDADGQGQYRYKQPLKSSDTTPTVTESFPMKGIDAVTP